MVIAIVIWLVLSIFAGVIASNKGRSGFGFFLLAIFLSPIVGTIGALIAKENTAVVETHKIKSGDNKKCPYCAELIKSEAKVCRYCGKDFPEEIQSSNNYNSITENPAESINELDRLDMNGDTQLMRAAAKGDIDKVNSLLYDGANAHVKDRNGMTAKSRAINRGNSEIARILESAESFPDRS